MSVKNRLCWIFIFVSTSFLPNINAQAEKPPTAEQAKFFENKVRPLLIKKCIKCHGPNKQESELRLDSRKAMFSGGETGPAIVSTKPEKSLLIEAVNHESLEMPPKEKMSDAQIAIFTRWVTMGAPWPKTSPIRTTAKFSDKERNWWAFQKVKPIKVPVLKPALISDKWLRNDIDRFILRKLQEKGLTPSPRATRQQLVRRLYFNLTGLPPTPEQVAAFVADRTPDAYEKLIDQLLASPRYGERWGRHWLDVVRYAESDGFKADHYRPNAWRYRDYVVRSFNDDKPYDQFVREQIAGDELAPNRPDALIATGFLRLGSYEFNQRDVYGQWNDILDDVTNVTAEAFLGLSFGCAKCHDHKFDPILQKDYYRLRAFFGAMIPHDDVKVATNQQRAAFNQNQATWELKTRAIRKQIAALNSSYYRKATANIIIKFTADVQHLFYKPAFSQSPLEKQIADLVNRQVLYEQSQVKLNAKDKIKLKQLQAALKKFDSIKPKPLPVARTVRDVGSVSPAMVVPGRDSHENILPGYLSLFSEKPAQIIQVPNAPYSTGRRTALANWLTQRDNPLTTRVIVNRIWQHHFGRGLVGTSNDFGRLGELPSHPELLDWLATRFQQQGWRMKSIHKMILMSATYQQSATHPNAVKAEMIDLENRLRWRTDIRRLDAEQIRDSILYVSGLLDLKSGGAGVNSTLPRRSIFTKVIRNKPDAVLSAFDAADGLNSTAQRNLTTTATQALMMINSKWTNKQAMNFASRVARTKLVNGKLVSTRNSTIPITDQSIEIAYRLAFSRYPTSQERAEGEQFIQSTLKAKEQKTTPLQALTDFCHVLLNSNEFIYLE